MQTKLFKRQIRFADTTYSETNSYPMETQLLSEIP